MPNTTWGIWYPESTDHTRLWEHLQQLAESVDTTVIAPIYASRALSQELANNTAPGYVTVPFDTDNGSSGLVYNSFDQFVVDVPGRYSIGVTLTWLPHDDGYRGMNVAVNDVIVRRLDQRAPRGNNFSLSLSATLTLAAGDLVEVRARSSAAADLNGDPTNNYVDLSYTGRAL